MAKQNRSFFRRVSNAVSRRWLNLTDGFTDRRICGQSLVKYVPSVYRDDQNGVGSTGSQSTPYRVLKRIFSHVELKPEDVFLDVGCGKGRVLAFLIREKCPCPLYGIELNEESGKVAAEWVQRYEQAQVMIGDAFQLDYNRFTVLFFARPFLPKTFLSFTELLEEKLTHPITMIYWCDQQSGYLLKDRPGWKKLMREKIVRIRGVRIAASPQYYSIWRYDPEQKAVQSRP